MIVPNPAVLQQAVDRYRALAADGNIAVSLQNAAYTLCVLTGTRTVEEALTAADRLCSRATASGSPHRRTLTLTSTSTGPLGSSGETASGERELVA
ncbi:DUF5133 domain-containing protein [Streptomyces sp. NPDC001073]|uniref:DUF5133 domain-containing protein n=1 Tax=Streptomyces sp. NPDC001642 TaxID=3154392 RepID=UPI00332B2756